VALYNDIHIIYCIFNIASWLLLICYFGVVAEQAGSPSPG